VITIKRTAAIGDILMMTPIVQALIRKHGEVFLQVAPSLHDKMHALLNCPGVLTVTREAHGDVIDLNNAYELRPHLHPVEAYALAAGVDLADTTRAFCNKFYGSASGGFDVIIHATKSWPNRTLPLSFWAELVKELQAAGLSVACVAQNVGEVVPGCDSVFIGRELPFVAGLIQYGANVFICGDSGPLHLAACTDTPIIGLFTIATAERRKPWKRENFVGINAAVNCVGCLHRAPMPCSFIDCEFQDERKHACLNGFSIAEIVEKAKGFI
jgi:ADP-heptose:LPS heptosyltransferase